jgi:hypothetical protein
LKHIAVLTVAFLLTATPVLAKPDNDPGYKIMHDYVLTLPKVKAYDTAYAALTTAAKADPSLKADLVAASAEQDPTVADTIDKMTKHPRLYAFFQKQGLSKMEASLLPIILMDACMGVQYPAVATTMANMVAPGQIAFCRSNGAVLQTMSFLAKR